MTTLDPRALEETLLAAKDRLQFGFTSDREVNQKVTAKIDTILAALSQPQAGEPVAEPCGGCGETNPDKRCIGCLHPFATLSVPQWPIDTDDQVEALARECGWNNRKYMTATDYAIWCEQMRKFAVLASPQPALAVKGLTWSEGGFAHTNTGVFYRVLREPGFWKLEAREGSSTTNSAHPTEEAAKAAAQADYETRIRSALVASPPPSGEVAERMRAILTNGLKPSFVGGQLQIAIDDDVFSALAALSVAPATADGWRTMDSAPKDGTVILVVKAPKGEAYAAYYGAAKDAFGAGVADQNYPWVFLDPTNGVNGLSDNEHGPTHWMPLPAAPTATGGR